MSKIRPRVALGSSLARSIECCHLAHVAPLVRLPCEHTRLQDRLAMEEGTEEDANIRAEEAWREIERAVLSAYASVARHV